ncbi:MAG: hypothetical protein ACLQVY_26895 [Limisphaerales bacterium]
MVGDTPLLLLHATNVLVNGNGCKVLITNPRIGFLQVHACSNVIVQGFSVDYDPLPFTQGVVTHNFYASNDVPKEKAIEFAVDPGYPWPTNANYIDSNAVAVGLRWGMLIDPDHPGRVAPGASAQCFYTNANGAFKMYLTSSSDVMATIQPGGLWCMISCWNVSMVFSAVQSYQVTFLNNTNCAAAGESYVASYTPLVSEIGGHIEFGPPPAGATAPRRRTSNSDGGLMIESRIGPWVQGCVFDGLSDDTANACTPPFIVTNTMTRPANTFALFKNGSSTELPPICCRLKLRLEIPSCSSMPPTVWSLTAQPSPT